MHLDGHFEFCLRDKFWDFSSTKSYNVQTTGVCLSCLKWPRNTSEYKARKTRQHNNRHAKLVGIKPSLCFVCRTVTSDILITNGEFQVLVENWRK